MERAVDLAAVGRIARRVELKNIRLTDISAACDPRIFGPLAAVIDVDCLPGAQSETALEVTCEYSFSVLAEQTRAAAGRIKYSLSYDLTGSDPISSDDFAEFARANGVLHSWPFVRELLFGLTSRMGYPPYTLPVMHFTPKPSSSDEVPPVAEGDTPVRVVKRPRPHSES